MSEPTILVRDTICSCTEGKVHIEAEWQGWRFFAGQCCDCLNIQFAHEIDPEDVEQIHVCDLDGFIEALQAIQKARSPDA